MTALFWWTSFLAFLILSLVCYIRKLQVINVPSFWSLFTLFPHVRALQRSFPKTMADWLNLDCDFAKRRSLDRAWLSLGPFFSSHGYHLYEMAPGTSGIFPPLNPRPCETALQTYPYARRVGDEPPSVIYSSSLVWAARDQAGREVVIKIVSEIDKPSQEWLVLQRLHEKGLRSNPRNHTIYTLDYLLFKGFVFVVMPRWDMSHWPPFSAVSELMEFAKVWLEVLVFLHENRIAHQDFININTGINAFGSSQQLGSQQGLRNAGEVQYALYDFGHSLIYPMDTDISKVTVRRFLRFHHGLPGPKGEYNPFKADVAMMGGMLNLMVVEKFKNEIPGIVSLFERMMHNDEAMRPTAHAALAEFETIFSSMSLDQLDDRPVPKIRDRARARARVRKAA